MTAPSKMNLLLRAEGLTYLISGVAAIHYLGGQWWLAALLFLAPDLSFTAYLAGPRIGAYAYNALHTTLGPLALAAMGLLSGWNFMLFLSAVWLAHIGFDRILGYGLKRTTSFGDTHLGPIGSATKVKS